MIDFFRTSTAMDVVADGSAKLLAAVIAHSIESASSKPNALEEKYRMNMDTETNDPKTSLWFLFDPKSPFVAYARLIGLDADSIRDALLDPNKKYGPKSPFSEIDARTFRLRYNWYRNESALVNFVPDEFEALT